MQDGEQAVNTKLSEMEAAGTQLKAELTSLTKYTYTCTKITRIL